MGKMPFPPKKPSKGKKVNTSKMAQALRKPKPPPADTEAEMTEMDPRRGGEGC